ncbi:MFS transporter [Paenibacillus maysiensis]|uniref:MFS transporter n=1 Tax=Paenibacillus maysiensis TaxID=1155954 RepID=UPI000472E1B9|nr:MFS transporter [Paenibacillus maysiensis]
MENRDVDATPAVSPQESGDFITYRYRWVILAVVSLLCVSVELHYLTFASITGEAAKFYQVSDFSINQISILFMLLLVILSLPAAYLINKLGLYKGIGFGAVLVGIFSVVKGMYANDFTVVFYTSMFIAVAQPFIVTSATRVCAVWFPARERTTVSGVITFSQFIGMGVAMSFSSVIAQNEGIPSLLWIYGLISLVISIIFLVFMRDKPPTPPCLEGDDVRLSFREGLRHCFKTPSAVILIYTFFIGTGVYNAVSTCIEQILRPHQLGMGVIGLMGGVLLVVAMIGTFIWAVVSDKMRKRKPALFLGSLLFIPGLVLLNVASSFTLVVVACVLLGLAAGTGALGYQYAAEITFPAPETISQSIIMISGSISGILFVVAMNAFGDFIVQSLYIFAALIAVGLMLQLKLKETLGSN